MLVQCLMNQPVPFSLQISEGFKETARKHLVFFCIAYGIPKRSATPFFKKFFNLLLGATCTLSQIDLKDQKMLQSMFKVQKMPETFARLMEKVS